MKWFKRPAAVLTGHRLRNSSYHRRVILKRATIQTQGSLYVHPN